MTSLTAPSAQPAPLLRPDHLPYPTMVETCILRSFGSCRLRAGDGLSAVQVSLAHILRSYEAVLPRHNIPLATDTYFYRILIRLSLNGDTPSWRVRLLAECQRARQSYGAANQSSSRNGHNALAEAARAADRGLLGQKRRQSPVPRATRAQPKRARSLSGLPASFRRGRTRPRSTSPNSRRPLVSFRDRDEHDNGKPAAKSSRVICDGFGCSRSREQSPERISACESLRDLSRPQSSNSRRTRASNRSPDHSPERAAVYELLREWGARSSSPTHRPSASRRCGLRQDGHVAQQAAREGVRVDVRAHQPRQTIWGTALHDVPAPRLRRRSCQQCLDLKRRSAASVGSNDWDPPSPDGPSESGVDDLTCPGCGQCLGPEGEDAPIVGTQMQRPSQARSGISRHLSGLHKLDSLRELIRQWRGTAHAATCGSVKRCVLCQTQGIDPRID